MSTSTKIKVFILVLASLATGWGIDALYRESISQGMSGESLPDPDIAVSEKPVAENPDVEKVVPTPAPVVEPPPRQIKQTSSPAPKQHVKVTIAIAYELAKISDDSVNYLVEYLQSQRAKNTVTDHTLTDWAKRVCMQPGSTVEMQTVQSYFSLFYGNFVSGYTADSFNTAYQLGVTPTYTNVDTSQIFNIAIQEAVKNQCPEKQIIW